MKILITGSGGFIGRNLMEKLQNKYEILAPPRKIFDLMNTEQVDAYLKKSNFDVVIHAANVNNTRRKDITLYESLNGNLLMFYNLERCSRFFGKMYYFGSGAEYDRKNEISYVKEEDFGKYIPKDAYGFSKYIMAKNSFTSKNIYNLRLYGVYGKYEEWERRFISNAIYKGLRGASITLSQNAYFDYLWIDDLAQIMEWFIENTPKYKHYNVCSGNRVDLLSLAHLVCDKLNRNCKIEVSLQGYQPEYSGDNSRMLGEIENCNFTKVENGIEQLIHYYKTHWEEIRIDNNGENETKKKS